MKSTHEQQTRVSLSQYDDVPVTVVLDRKLDIVCSGVGDYQRDKNLGYVLRIRLKAAESGGPVITLSERKWQGKIIPDQKYGTKYCFILPDQEQ